MESPEEQVNELARRTAARMEDAILTRVASVSMSTSYGAMREGRQIGRLSGVELSPETGEIVAIVGRGGRGGSTCRCRSSIFRCLARFGSARRQRPKRRRSFDNVDVLRPRSIQYEYQ